METSTVKKTSALKNHSIQMVKFHQILNLFIFYSGVLFPLHYGKFSENGVKFG